MPQGREIFPQLTVLENLQVGLLANPRGVRQVPDLIFQIFPRRSKTCSSAKAVFSAAANSSSLPSPAVLVAEPKVLILDEPTEGIQPNVITLIGQVLKTLKQSGQFAVLLVEQYLEFALTLADTYYVMEKGAIVLEGRRRRIGQRGRQTLPGVLTGAGKHLFPIPLFLPVRMASSSKIHIFTP